MIKRLTFFFAWSEFLSVCAVVAFGAATLSPAPSNLTLTTLNKTVNTVSGTIDFPLTHDEHDTVFLSMVVPGGGSAVLKGPSPAGVTTLVTSYKLTGDALLVPDPPDNAAGWIDSTDFVLKSYQVKTPVSLTTETITLHVQGGTVGANPPPGTYTASFILRATW